MRGSRIGIGFSFFLMALATEGAEVLFQRCLASTSVEIWPSPATNVLARDEDLVEDQVVGDQRVACSSQADFQTLSLFALSELAFRHTNSLGDQLFVIESDLNVQSEGDLDTVSAEFVTKASCSASAQFRLQSDTPFHYTITISNQSPALSPNYGGITIRTAGGHSVLDLAWDSGMGNSPQAQGNLPAGLYDVAFGDATYPVGGLSPTMQNLINGTAKTVLSFTVTAQPVAPTTPVLNLRRAEGDLVLLEMTNLRPGTFYFIERNDAIVPGSWDVVANFIAGGTNAIWGDAFDQNAGKVFYRLRYLIPPRV
jgi:hypothetical protein